MNMICPQCNKDDAIQKVSAVVAGGRASGSFSGYSGGAVNIDGKWGTTSSYTTLGGSTASDLAKILALPLEPRKKSAGINAPGCIGSLLALPIACICTYLVYAMLGAFMLKFDSATVIFRYASIVIGAFISLCFLVGILWVLLKEARKEKDKTDKEIENKYVTEKALWDNAMNKWNRLYYCHRDGLVFDPENGKTCQPTQIQEFVYE